MSNQSGRMYGLTILSPIRGDATLEVSHDAAIRMYLQKLPRHEHSPFARVSGTHLCRLVVMDDVVFVGHPAREEHLKSKYLIFNSNLYGDADTYLEEMARRIPQVVEDIWSHCVGFPGVTDPKAFVAYMKKCQLETSFFFADVNDKTVEQTLRALLMKAEFAAFVEEHQGRAPAELQAAFAQFWDRMRNAPLPDPGALEPGRRAAVTAAGKP